MLVSKILFVYHKNSHLLVWTVNNVMIMQGDWCARLYYQPLFRKGGRTPPPKSWPLLISTNKESACLNGAGCKIIFLALAEKLCDMKSDHVIGTSNQIPSSDEIMPDLNHSGIYNTQSSQQTSSVRIFIWVMWYQKVIKERDKCKHQSQEKKYSSNLMCTLVFLKESNTILWQSQSKLNF